MYSITQDGTTYVMHTEKQQQKNTTRHSSYTVEILREEWGFVGPLPHQGPFWGRLSLCNSGYLGTLDQAGLQLTEIYLLHPMIKSVCHQVLPASSLFKKVYF